MNSLKISARRAGSVFAAAALVLTTALPGLASAAQVTERSIELSSSSAGATNVSYTINFTVPTDAGAAVVEFCSNSPLLGDTCSVPAGFSLSSATVSGGFTKVTDSSSATKLTVTGTIDADANDGKVSIPVAAVTNPTAAGPLYARIVTYATNAAAYTTADPDAGEDHLDDGGVAISITPTIGVSGAVQESLTFCVSGGTIDPNCTKSGGGPLDAPTIRLGETVGTTTALSSTAVSEGNIYTQVSTNAAKGAVISLKNNVACGGMKRFEVTTCDIAPAGTTGFTTIGEALFGVKTAAASADADGTIQPINGYESSKFVLKFNNTTSGVSSAYGDQILDTDEKPANNKNMQLTFGATITNSTPAGNYSADLSLIATGKF